MKKTAIGILALFLLAQTPAQKATAQPAMVTVPIGAAIVIIGGISYYVWINSQGVEQTLPVSTGGYLEDPEEADQWGEYPAIRTYQGCRWQAAGREWEWDAKNNTCWIKG